MSKTTNCGARRTGLLPLFAIVCALLWVAPAPVSAEGWCDLVFVDVLDEAESVIIAGYQKKANSPPKFTVQEVLKGSCTDAELDLDPEELAFHAFRDGDQLVVALTDYHQPVRIVHGMGGCTAVSVLPIRNGKLRSRERENYDVGHKSITLEALRAELLALLHPDSQ